MKWALILFTMNLNLDQPPFTNLVKYYDTKEECEQKAKEIELRGKALLRYAVVNAHCFEVKEEDAIYEE